MSFETGKPYEQVDNGLFKKGGLFDAIFGGKMQALLDKVGALFNVNKVPDLLPKPASNLAEVGAKAIVGNDKNKLIMKSSSRLGDMTYLAEKYPKQARAKNNNPSGITWNEKFDNPTPNSNAYAFREAGIQYMKGSQRPKNEWITKNGQLVPTYYVKFATMDDGLRAKKIMLERSQESIRDRFAKWVGHKDKASNYRYADGILRDAGIDGNKRFSELTEAQKDRLMMAQIKQESSGLHKELIARNVTPIANNIA